MALTRHTLAILLVLIGTLVSISPGCGGEAPDRGESGEGQGTGVRLAVLSPALTIILRDMGLADRIVGRHGFDLVLDEGVPVVGNELGLDYEALVRVAPTHVLLETNERGVPSRLEALAAERGWAIVTIALDESVDDIRRALGELDALLPESGRGARVRALEREMDRAWGAREGFGERVGRVLLLVGVDPPGVLGPGSFHFDLVERLGGEPVPREGAMFIRMPVEEVVKLDPDSIVLFMPGVEAGAAEMLGKLGEVGLRAVEGGRVMVVRHPHCLTPSTAMIEVADEIASKASAWAPVSGEEP